MKFLHSEGGPNDEQFYKDFKLAWDAVIDQKTALVCLKAGSDEIVGVSMTYVKLKDDPFNELHYDSV